MIEKWLSGGLLGRERALLLSANRAVFINSHVHITAYADCLAQATLRAAEHLSGAGMAVLFCKFGKRDSAHSDVLNSGSTGQV
ncbi:hypothetical protein D3C81_705910 [compost metagenome]